MAIPELRGDARRAVEHRGSHLQIIASAGSGKTEVVAQRVAALFADGVSPHEVVAFTFTDSAATELKNRIKHRVAARSGTEFLGKLNGCFVGTIHSYCFRLLQQHVSRYETYDVLDEHRLAAFLTRVSRSIDLNCLDPGGKLFSAIKIFVRNLDALENELMTTDELNQPFKGVAEGFLRELERYRLLTYGQVIARAVAELRNAEVFEAVHGPLRHLIVDEYQDINPAQEALIEQLAAPPVELCVVGDDDQSIYQWRGSDVSNIVRFAKRYSDVRSFTVSVNRRSRPAIVETANAFAETIEGRLPKSMRPSRLENGVAIASWSEATEEAEANRVAETIQRLYENGFSYREMAVLVRGSTAFPRLMAAFQAHGIPVQPGGRTGLFEEDDAQLFGRTIAWLAGHQWRPRQYGARPLDDDLESLLREYEALFTLSSPQTSQVRRHLERWHAQVDHPSGPANLIDAFYDLLSRCGVADWDFGKAERVARLGTLARCSAILADYESVRRRARPDDNAAGAVVGGQDRGTWYYKWLAIHVQNWALGAFEGFEGEDRFSTDAVDVTTVHKAKGLEWPVVFVPSLSANRFPSRNTGRREHWLAPLDDASRVRYEGTVNDERRLFYVALTRARDWLSLSTHDTPNMQRVAPSPFLEAVAGGAPDRYRPLQLPRTSDRTAEPDDILAITFSELADYRACGLAFRLRNLMGFQPPLAPELGYGRAVHHILRNIGEYTRQARRPPNPAQLELMFDDEFYLPLANSGAHERLKVAARRLVSTYVDSYGEELKDTWAVERPFELHLDNAVISGRADVILEERGGVQSLVIVDYKTSANGELDYAHQLQVYSDAGRREGLNVRAAYVHDLREGIRHPVDVAPSAIESAEVDAVRLVEQLKGHDYRPNPGAGCARCDVRQMCRYAAA